MQPEVVLSIWDRVIQKVERNLRSVTVAGDLVDVVRSCNLRAKHASARASMGSRFSNHFAYFADRWDLIKYQALLQACQMRRRAESSVKIGYHVQESGIPSYAERLTFVFEIDPNPYRTEVALSSLARLLPREQLMDLLEPFDRLAPLPEKKRFEIFRHRGFATD